MKFSTVSMFRKNLSAKKICPIYFLAGEENFLLDDCLKRIEKIINIDDLNREVFQANGYFKFRRNFTFFNRKKDCCTENGKQIKK